MISVGPARVMIDPGEVTRLIESRGGPVARPLARVGADIEAQAKRRASGDLVGVRTGRLRSGYRWQFQSGSRLGIVVFNNVNYSGFIEEGTRYVGARNVLRTAIRDVLGPGLA